MSIFRSVLISGKKDGTNEPRSGRPPTAFTQEKIELLEKGVDIGSVAINIIISDHLKYKKILVSRWVPHSLTETKNLGELNGVLSGVLLHHGNARPHTSAQTLDFLANSGVQLVTHPTYSPDLAPCDFFISKGVKFDTDDETLQAFINAVNSIPEDDWCKCFDNWFSRMKSFIGAMGVVNPTPPIEPFLAQRGFWERGDELQYASLEHPTHALLDSGPEIWLANPSFEYSHSGDIH
ncbi:hypothetical protein LAZ67_X001847 [Cordylochernes scorpioides]|uniref:Transposase n=1 Tax=Cordylochernes scorpioides TaxID=51811 RepID=A0ABY6LSV0_9ARAC|nr:hypothetical protein LAZ67_X001847 [Cordylochernes scorpioides]